MAHKICGLVSVLPGSKDEDDIPLHVPTFCLFFLCLQKWRGEVGIEPDSHLDLRQANGFAARGGTFPLLPDHYFIINILNK